MVAVGVRAQRSWCLWSLEDADRLELETQALTGAHRVLSASCTLFIAGFLSSPGSHPPSHTPAYICVLFACSFHLLIMFNIILTYE